MKQFYLIFGRKNHYVKLTVFFNILTMLKTIVKKTLVKMNMFTITCPLRSLIEQGAKKLKRKILTNFSSKKDHDFFLSNKHHESLHFTKRILCCLCYVFLKKKMKLENRNLNL